MILHATPVTHIQKELKFQFKKSVLNVNLIYNVIRLKILNTAKQLKSK